MIKKSLPEGFNYEEALVPSYTLPDPLIAEDGTAISDAETWMQKRRPELLRLFSEHVYGRAPIGRPEGMSWEVVAEDRDAINGRGITKTVTIYLTGNKDNEPCTRLNLHITLPKRDHPVPVFLTCGYGLFHYLPEFNRNVFERGYGMVYCDAGAVQKDDKDAYETSIRYYYDSRTPGFPSDTSWGTLAAWSWAMRRAMDYLETDPDIDAGKVCGYGFSRRGKAALWAGAQDERIAITISGESGCGGAALLRRQFGETVRRITTVFPHWFAKKFEDYRDDAVHGLPIDAHELIALHAPRPVYIATAEEDLWGDPHGSFLAGVHADPVYALFGKTGVGTNELPPVNTPVGDTIGFHLRTEGHRETEYDWERFVDFADRHFARQYDS